MKGKYLRRIGGIALTALMLLGIGFVSANEAEAQSQKRRKRVIIVRPYRPFGFGHRGWWGHPWGYDPWAFERRYSHYIFDDSDEAVEQAYKDGFKTGKSDGKKNKSYNPQRSHYYKEAGFGNFAEVYRPTFSRGYQDGYRAGADERERKRAG
jgi:hypothetical protein